MAVAAHHRRRMLSAERSVHTSLAGIGVRADLSSSRIAAYCLAVSIPTSRAVHRSNIRCSDGSYACQCRDCAIPKANSPETITGMAISLTSETISIAPLPFCPNKRKERSCPESSQVLRFDLLEFLVDELLYPFGLVVEMCQLARAFQPRLASALGARRELFFDGLRDELAQLRIPKALAVTFALRKIGSGISSVVFINANSHIYGTPFRRHLTRVEFRNLAPRHGFEPRFTAPKAAVLPLDDRGITTAVSFFSVTFPDGQLQWACRLRTRSVTLKFWSSHQDIGG
jgi:hypothetical protein